MDLERVFRFPEIGENIALFGLLYVPAFYEGSQHRPADLGLAGMAHDFIGWERSGFAIRELL